MRLLMCADPLDGRRVDPMYADEAEAGSRLGLGYELLDFEALVNDADAERAVRRVRATSPTSEADDAGAAGDAREAVYRGWMLRPEQYDQLWRALLRRGVRLVNDPAAYRRCHLLPGWYPLLLGHTPRSVWLADGPEPSMTAIMDALRVFGAGPVVLKDFVKSRKHEWATACFIPSAADRSSVERVVQRFVDLQGDDLVGGLVFRQYVELAPVGQHPHSGMPLGREFRLWFAEHRLIACHAAWDDVPEPAMDVPLERFVELARRIESRFFTMDVAQDRHGGWWIVELGDGQVAGLTRGVDVAAFYAALVAAFGGAV